MQCSGHANIKQSLLNGGLQCNFENKSNIAFHQSTLLTKRQNNIVLGRCVNMGCPFTDERSEAERGKANCPRITQLKYFDIGIRTHNWREKMKETNLRKNEKPAAIIVQQHIAQCRTDFLPNRPLIFSAGIAITDTSVIRSISQPVLIYNIACVNGSCQNDL